VCIGAYGLVTAYYDQSMGAVYTDPKMQQEVKGIMEEIYALAKLEGVALPSGCVEKSFHKAKQFPYETKTSFQRDYEKTNGRDERDIFGEAIINLARKWQITVPTTQKIYEGLIRG